MSDALFNGNKFRTLTLVDNFTRECLAIEDGQSLKPFIESFNGSSRDEFLNVNWFMSLEDARQKIENWKQDYNVF